MSKVKRNVIGRRHIGIARIQILRLIDQHGVSEVLEGFDGTDEEAMKMVRESPRNVWPVGDCDNYDDDGCLGHPPRADEEGR